MDNEDVGRPVADYFGVTGDSPKVKHFSSLHHFLCMPILFHTNGNLILVVLLFGWQCFRSRLLDIQGMMILRSTYLMGRRL